MAFGNAVCAWFPAFTDSCRLQILGWFSAAMAPGFTLEALGKLLLRRLDGDITTTRVSRAFQTSPMAPEPMGAMIS
jgi:hypothetical protein